jgi:hypothetical protein
MPHLILQVQLLLAALSALLPLLTADQRARAAAILDLAAGALAAASSVSSNLDDLAARLAEVRDGVESAARTGRAVTADELDAAMARVRAASTAFRAALAEQT